MSFRERRDDHRLVIEHVLFEDGVLVELDLTIEHPEPCSMKHWNAPATCALGHEEIAIGLSEALGLATFKTWRGHGKTVLTEAYSELAYALVGFALTTSRVSFPLTYIYRSWTDRNGEGDVEMQWWIR
jgi:hypothetical protein